MITWTLAARRLVSPARPRLLQGQGAQPCRDYPREGAPAREEPAGSSRRRTPIAETGGPPGLLLAGRRPRGIVVGLVQTDRAGWEEHHAGVGPAAARRRRVVRPAVSGRRRNHPVVGVGPNWRQWFCPLVMANWRAWRMVAGMLLGRPLRLQDVQRVGDQGVGDERADTEGDEGDDEAVRISEATACVQKVMFSPPQAPAPRSRARSSAARRRSPGFDPPAWIRRGPRRPPRRSPRGSSRRQGRRPDPRSP